MTRTFDLVPLQRYTVGFDHIFRELDKLTSNSTNYPPYNIIREGDDKFTIELAVAGYQESDLDVTLEKGILTIQGAAKNENDERDYMYKGIGMRNFTRYFRLSEHIEVDSAKLVNGLLSINLHYLIPEELKSRKISINSN